MDHTIASMLKQLRKSSHLSVKQAVRQLKQYGIDIASKTLYGYESGLSMPNADVFLSLCKIYHCEDLSEIAEYAASDEDTRLEEQTDDNLFTPDELSFLNDYRELDSFGQDIVRQMIEHEKERIRQIKHSNDTED